MAYHVDYRAMGERVRQCRRAKGVTQERLAERVDISCSFVGHIERGEKKASAETVAALCAALDVSADYLLLGLKHRCEGQACALYADLRALLERYGYEVQTDQLK